MIKSVRKLARLLGRVLDEEDRKVIGYGLVIIAAGGAAVVMGAGALGLAVRVFELAAG